MSDGGSYPPCKGALRCGLFAELLWTLVFGCSAWLSQSSGSLSRDNGSCRLRRKSVVAGSITGSDMWVMMPKHESVPQLSVSAAPALDSEPASILVHCRSAYLDYCSLVTAARPTRTLTLYTLSQNTHALTVESLGAQKSTDLNT